MWLTFHELHFRAAVESGPPHGPTAGRRGASSQRTPPKCSDSGRCRSRRVELIDEISGLRAFLPFAAVRPAERSVPDSCANVGFGLVTGLVAPRRDVLVQHDVEAPMRDGVVLRANVYRPADDGRVPGAPVAAAVQQGRQHQLDVRRPGATGGSGLHRRYAGRPRPLRLRRRVHRERAGVRRRLRRGAVGRRDAGLGRHRRDVRPLLPLRDPVAGRGDAAARVEEHGDRCLALPLFDGGTGAARRRPRGRAPGLDAAAHRGRRPGAPVSR